MGKVLTEEKLEFDFRSAVSSIKFDDQSHGLSHCMKAVDFIVETLQIIYLIEVKDIDNTSVPPNNAANYYKELLSGKLISEKLVPKARDSFLYNYLLDRLPQKPIVYVVIIAFSRLQAPEFIQLTEKLEHSLPLRGPNHQPWNRPYFDHCIVMNLNTWNKNMPQFPVKRLP